MRVSVNVLVGNPNAAARCKDMAKGIVAVGDTAVMRGATQPDVTGFDAAVLWGFTTECQQVVQACKAVGIPWVFIDSGYQKRSTYFKVVVNSRHPEAYLMNTAMPSDRFRQWGVEIKPWRSNLSSTDPIVVAGMSPKAAWSSGFDFEQFERAVIETLRSCTKRPIIYRPKASNPPNAKPIPGATIDGKTPLLNMLAKAHCVVAHNSNVGCDALLAGVPVFTRCGAARPMALTDSDLAAVEMPYLPHDREQWAYNLAYCQWSSPEMVSGECWRHVKTLMGKTATG